jgi:hypothetical protein
MPMKTLLSLRSVWVTATLGLMTAGLRADPPRHFQDIAKWAVSYDDAQLGRVEGVAFCEWNLRAVHVRLRNPLTHQLQALETTAVTDVSFGDTETDYVSLVLHGRSPSGKQVVAPGSSDVRGLECPKDGSVHFRNDGGDNEVAVKPRGVADQDIVKLKLRVRGFDDLAGQWSYIANPVTERDANGFGRVGTYRTLPDSTLIVDVDKDGKPRKRDGFLGQQTGEETWNPLPPQIVAVEPVEDQTAYDGSVAEYPKSPGAARTLVVIGRDLPVDADWPVYTMTRLAEPDDNGELSAKVRSTRFEVLTGITSGNPAISYEVVALAGMKNLKPEDEAAFEVVRARLTKKMDPQSAAAFRRLEAVLVRAKLTAAADAGPQTLEWAGASSAWFLQYGDNDIETRLVRVFRDQTGDTAETVLQLALPEVVQIELQPRSYQAADTLPVRLGNSATPDSFQSFTATREPNKPALYRTPPIVFYATGEKLEAAVAGASAIAVRKGSRVLAGVDRTKTHYLRSTPADVLASEAPSLWSNALKHAADSNHLTVTDWSAFPKKPAETFKLKGESVDISYGDHAAMLILRDAFLQTMRGQLAMLEQAGADDRMLDAWYATMHSPVTQAPGLPLAAERVKGPDGGEIPFGYAYSWSYAQKTFHPYERPEGLDAWRTWRRAASREALKAYRAAMEESLATVEKIGDGDRLELVKLTGSGFGRIAAKIDPLLMRYRAEDKLCVPDRTARAYIAGLDTLAARVSAIKDWSSVVNKTIVAGAALAVGFPAMAWGGFYSTVGALVGGFAIFGGQSAHEIYETYQQHEEVRFEFGASAPLGLERYFDAQTRLTPWWKTGVSIFGQGMLQLVGGTFALGSLEELAVGPAVWRGQTWISQVNKGGLAALRELPPAQQRDLAACLLEARGQMAAARILGPRERYAAALFEELAEESSGLPKAQIVEPAELPAAAVSGVDDFTKAETVVADVLHDAKEEAAAVGLLQDARTELSESAILQEGVQEGGTELGQTARMVRAGQMMKGAILDKIKFFDHLPRPGLPWKVVVGGKEMTLEVEEVLGQGAFFTAYRLKGDPEALGRDLVLKVCNFEKPDEIGAIADQIRSVLKKQSFEEPEDALRALIKLVDEHPPAMRNAIRFEVEVPGITRDVIQRMETAQALLKRGNIPHLQIHTYEGANFVLQNRVNFAGGKFRLFSGADLKKLEDISYRAFAQNDPVARAKILAERDVIFPKPLSEAALKLFKQLEKEKLAWCDCHLGNLYFENTTEGWVAGILDQDLITTVDKVQEGVTGAYLKYWTTHGRIPTMGQNFKGDLGFSTPSSFMGKMLEGKGWLRFSRIKRIYEPGLFDPPDVKKAFDELPYVNERGQTPDGASLDPGRRSMTKPSNHQVASIFDLGCHLGKWLELRARVAA